MLYRSPKKYFQSVKIDRMNRYLTKIFVFLIAPDHAAARNNKEYYIDLLRNQTSDPNFDSTNLKLLPMVIKNQRPTDYLGEGEVYEELCRQDEPKVKDHFHEK